jgi:hypothetical protein
MPPLRYVLSLLFLLLAASTAPAWAQPEASVTAFVGVTVLPMDEERALENQTVVVRGDRIVTVGPAASVSVPTGAREIDGRGRYLMPGLAEMHAHIPGPQASDELMERLMFLYVANGVTTIRGMLGAPNQLVLRERTASGELLGPTVIVGAPSLNGNSASDPQTAQRIVRESVEAGYDFLKLHPGLSREVYDAIVEQAVETGITWAGHISADVGLEHTLATGQSTIDHLDGYLEAVLGLEQMALLASGGVPFAEGLGRISPEEVRRWAEATREAGVWNVPTAYLWESFYSTEPAETFLALPEMRYATPQWRAGWTQQKANFEQQQAAGGLTDADRDAILGFRRDVLKALADASAPLLMGTDSPQMFNVPGFALHRELGVMAEAGLSPYQILASGTTNVGRYAREDLGQMELFGEVAPGHRADLLLLTANPLTDVSHVAQRAGVMVRGVWVPEAEIQQRLAEIATAHTD